MSVSIIVFSALFGLLVGSFLNVVLLRFGFEESTRPRSHCQSCHHILHWYELIPLLSYLWVRGHCRHCGSRFSLQYPAVELTVGALFAAVAFFSLPISTAAGLFSFGALLLFWAVFVLLVVYDVRHTLVPTSFAWLLVGSALLVRLAEVFLRTPGDVLIDALLGGALLAGFLGLIVLLTRGKGMGAGDIYIGLALGILFGVGRGIEVITLAFWVGAAVGILLLITPRVLHAVRRALVLSPRSRVHRSGEAHSWFKMKSEIAFVPFLFIAALLGMFTAISPFTLVLWVLPA